MKLHHENEEIFGTDLNNAVDFTLKSSPKAFMVLSKNIYQYKERAIIRELSTNALDAHSAAGTLDRPFKLHFPTVLDPRFICRDYGTGLSKEDTIKLFTIYFESTKDQTNDYIGALGLGSKSPFSYTDTFNIVSYYNGKAYGFSAFLHNGMPKCLPIFEEDTEEENGLEITVPVNSKDIRTWYNEAKIILQHFGDHMPEVTPESLKTEIVEFPKFDNYITDVSGSKWGVYAIMGNIQYRIPEEFYENTWISTLNNTFIKFNIGDIDIMPSREEIHLSEQTKDVLKKRINEINIELMQNQVECLNELKTEREVYRAIYEKNLHDVRRKILVDANISNSKWNISEIDRKFYYAKMSEPNIIGGKLYNLDDIVYRPKKISNHYHLNSKNKLYNLISPRYCNSLICIIDDINKSKPRTDLLDVLQEKHNIDIAVVFRADNTTDMNTLEYIKNYFDESELFVYTISECSELIKMAKNTKKAGLRNTSKKDAKPSRSQVPNVYYYSKDDSGNWIMTESFKMTASEIRELEGYGIYSLNGMPVFKDDKNISRFDLHKVLDKLNVDSYYSINRAAKRYTENSKFVNLYDFITEKLDVIVKELDPAKLGYVSYYVGYSSKLHIFSYESIQKVLPKTVDMIIGKEYDREITEFLSENKKFMKEETQEELRKKMKIAKTRILKKYDEFKANNPTLELLLSEGWGVKLLDENIAKNFESLIK